jgi:hypothetical protein
VRWIVFPEGALVKYRLPELQKALDFYSFFYYYEIERLKNKPITLNSPEGVIKEQISKAEEARRALQVVANIGGVTTHRLVDFLDTLNDEQLNEYGVSRVS